MAPEPVVNDIIIRIIQFISVIELNSTNKPAISMKGNNNKKVRPYLKNVAVRKSTLSRRFLLNTVEVPKENAANKENNTAFIVLLFD